MRPRFPVRSQRIGTGLVLAGAYLWMGLNVWLLPTEPPEKPTWFPMPPESEPKERYVRNASSKRVHFQTNKKRFPNTERDTNLVWVQRPKMRYPTTPMDANTLDSVEVLRWGVSPTALASFFQERRTWRGFVSRDQLPNSASTWPIAWTFGPLPPPRVLHTLPKEALGKHPLIGWERATTYHRYRSRVRPVRSWEELRALPGWEEVDETLLRKYFVLSRKDSLSLHP